VSFTITCPICGRRDLYEFRFGGEVRGPRPSEEGLTPRDFCEWSHMRDNRPGAQEEWWYHRDGCGTWFTIWRDTTTNREVSRPEDEP
jgi:sarcosine oxidase subunit delta